MLDCECIVANMVYVLTLEYADHIH
jgi:hypothetical protein